MVGNETDRSEHAKNRPTPKLRPCSYEVGQSGVLGWLAKMGQFLAHLCMGDSVSDTWAAQIAFANFSRITFTIS